MLEAAIIILSLSIVASAIIVATSRKKDIVVKIDITEIQGTEVGEKTIFGKEVQTYWDGPVPSKVQEERNKQAIFEHLERFPNGVLAEKNPEYMDEYLSRIDLDLPDGIHTKKDPE